MVNLINKISEKKEVIFVCHSRTKFNLKINKLIGKFNKTVKLIDPLNYTQFSKLLIDSKMLITDSGGVHEEAFFHKKKCLVLRDKIEREQFLNNNYIKKVNFSNAEKIFKNVLKAKDQSFKTESKWDGKVSKEFIK